MKTQIIKIIPCLLAGFILSACVGSVNVPSGVAEKKTESEPIVLDPATILINRCIMDDNASDASCASAVKENSCITDPFGAACDLTFTDFYETARVNRISFCRTKNDDNLCTGAIENVCDKNPFDGLCANGFYTPRNQIITECRTDKTGSLCPQAIKRACSDNPFDMLCDESFEIARNNTITACRSNVGSNFISFVCSNAIEIVCSDNPFDTLCNRNFETTRNKIIGECRMDNTGNHCPQAIEKICLANPFDGLCNDGFQTARDDIITQCRISKSGRSCSSAIISVCDDNHFDGLCDNYRNYEMMRIDDCIMGENANMPRCTGAFDVNSCVLKPFGASCSRETNARNARESFCREGGNFMNPLCVSAVSHFCGVSVFDELCGSAYESMRIDDCIIAGNAGETRCTNAFTTGSCVLNPFGANCDSESYLADAQVNRVKFCSDSPETGINVCPQVVRDCLLNPFGDACIHDVFQKELMNRISFCGILTNKDKPTCAVALSRPNVASFLQSFDDSLHTLSSAGSKSAFLQGTETGLNLGEATDIKAGTYINISTLNLSSGDGSQSLGGDAVDGVGFVGGGLNDGLFYYAGILSGTDLGLPRTETEGTAMWNGQFGAFGRSTSNNVNKNFTLTVNFGAGEQAGTISAQVSTSHISYLYSITGNFDSSGVIRGDISFDGGRWGEIIPGQLRGLIGQEGAVGVFIGGKDTQNYYSYSGGFVARPPAE